MSTCRKTNCHREITWIEAENGVFHPPLENISALFPDSVLEELHRYRELFALVDGKLVPIRASGIYIKHRCSTEPEAEVDYTRPLIAAPNEFLTISLSVGCPLCEAEIGDKCVTPTGRSRKTPHAIRYRAGLS
jgi:hypothetical protein